MDWSTDYRCTFSLAAITSADYRPGYDAGLGSRRRRRRGSPGADGRAVAVDDLGLVLVPGGRRAIRVQDYGPAPLMNDNLVVKETKQGAVFDAGGAAVLAVPQVVDLAT